MTALNCRGRSTETLRLYGRSRGLPAAFAFLLLTAALAAWAADWLVGHPHYGYGARVPVVVFGPLLASAAVGTSLHTPSDELDRLSVGPWWPRRLAHLLGLTALAGLVLALAVPGEPDRYGAAAMVRNLLGATGGSALAAVALGARASWLPMCLYTGSVYLSAPRTRTGAATSWAWPMQPGPEPGAWVTAGTLFVVGVGLHAWRGVRREGR
ncbi:hypothetical protein [Streptomyces albipurpureus]|uniref:ABC transporter n=1 Tax=Streptomyces albipurpureus TaxID=2897419 RepID=A0ABT0UIL6_9ACTN|nr:hypothetical protein [Streptomyces sp. CWNU-1]MCM2388011.1 hypothetical protein [Streptomyces sp. CWNU-1]